MNCLPLIEYIAYPIVHFTETGIPYQTRQQFVMSFNISPVILFSVFNG